MDLKFKKIDNKGKDNEYILMQAMDGCNVHDYLIHDDTFDQDGELSNKLRHMYRFPCQEVNKGDYIALFVKKSGKYKLGTTTNNYPCHYFYWGANTDIFNEDGDNLYLLKIGQTVKIRL